MPLLDGHYCIEFTLDNGLRVIQYPTGNRTTSVKLHFRDAGALSEKNGIENGFAHFCEHCLFKGRKLGKEGSLSARGMIPKLNAETGILDVSVYGDVLPESVPFLLELIADFGFTPLLDHQIVEQEKRVVLREKADEESMAAYPHIRALNRTVYPDNIRTYNVFGTPALIKGATVTSMRDFHARHYGAKNATLIITGYVPVGIDKYVEKFFGKARQVSIENITLPPVTPLKKPIILHKGAYDLFDHIDTPESSCEITMVVHAPRLPDPDTYAVYAMTEILGGVDYFNARLFTHVREKCGLAYEINSEYDDYEGSQDIQIEGKLPALRKEEDVKNIFYAIRTLQDTPVTQEELDTVAMRMKYKLQAATNQRNLELIEAELRGRITPHLYLENAHKVTPDDVQRVANRYLPDRNNNVNYAMLIRDPLKGRNDFQPRL